MRMYLRIFFSHGFGQIVTIISNIVLPAILIRNYGDSEYSIWIAANALAQFFILVDFGGIYALSNKLCLEKWAGPEQAQLFFSVCYKKILARAKKSLFLSTTISIVCAYSLSGGFSDNFFSVAIINFALSLFVSFSQLTTLISATYRYLEKIEFGIFLQNFLRLLDAILLLILSYWLNLEQTALFLMVVKILQFYIVRRYVLNLMCCNFSSKSLNPSHSFILDVSKVFTSGFGYAKWQFFQIFTIHGVTFFVAHHFSPSVALIFSLTRTLTKLPVQPVTLINQTVAPILTLKYRDNDFAGFKKLYFFSIGIAVSVTFLYLLILQLNYQTIFKLWLSKDIYVYYYDLLVLSISALVSVLTLSIANGINSVNKSESIGNLTMVLNGVLLLIMFVWQDAWTFSSFLLVLLIYDFAFLLMLALGKPLKSLR